MMRGGGGWVVAAGVVGAGVVGAGVVGAGVVGAGVGWAASSTTTSLLLYASKPSPAKILEGSLAGMANESCAILTLPVDESLSSCEYGELAEKRYTDPESAPPSSS